MTTEHTRRQKLKQREVQGKSVCVAQYLQQVAVLLKNTLTCRLPRSSSDQLREIRLSSLPVHSPTPLPLRHSVFLTDQVEI